MATRQIPRKVQAEVKEFIERIKKDDLEIMGVYVYGSYAKGTAGKWSDIDVAIISPSFSNIYDATQYLWSKRPSDEGLTIEPIGFDPTTFNESLSPLIGEIKNTGIKFQ